MIITLCSSMTFVDKLFEIKKELEKLGHKVLISEFAEKYKGKNIEEQEKLAIYHKNEKNAIIEHYDKIKKSDAILVINITKRGINNYIGGNTLMEIGFAYVLNKKIFLLNTIPEIDYYKSEIQAVKPVVINNELNKII